MYYTRVRGPRPLMASVSWLREVQMLHRILTFVICISVTCAITAKTGPSSATKTFLESTSNANRYKAIVHLNHHPKELSEYLIWYFSQPHEYNDSFNDHLYLAFLAKDKHLVTSLVAAYIALEKSDEECVYCCPIVLVLQAYYIDGLYKPTDFPLVSGQVEELTNSYRNYGLCISRIEVDNYSDPEYLAMIKDLQAMPTKKLAVFAADTNKTPMARVTAANELAFRSPRGASTEQLLSLSLIPSNDASGEYLCYLYDAILRNEYCQSHECK
jgi:hypothetical protein